MRPKNIIDVALRCVGYCSKYRGVGLKYCADGAKPFVTASSILDHAVVASGASASASLDCADCACSPVLRPSTVPSCLSTSHSHRSLSSALLTANCYWVFMHAYTHRRHREALNSTCDLLFFKQDILVVVTEKARALTSPRSFSRRI